MLTVLIDDPKDWNYPFPASLYEDLHVVYHGTSSTYSAFLESHGFVRGQLPFKLDKLRELLAICDQVGYRSWSYTTVSGLSSSTQIERRTPRNIYFSANFWYARDYATNIGGETVHNALMLGDEVLRFLAEQGNADPARAYAVRELLVEFKAATGGSRPVVYAVKIEQDWLEHDNALRRYDVGDYVVTAVNVSCATSVLPDQIVAKAVYVNGAESGYLGPQPARWSNARNICRV